MNHVAEKMGGKKRDDENQGWHQGPRQEEIKISLGPDSSRYLEGQV